MNPFFKCFRNIKDLDCLIGHQKTKAICWRFQTVWHTKTESCCWRPIEESLTQSDWATKSFQKLISVWLCKSMYMGKTVYHIGSDLVLLRKGNTNLHSFMKMTTLVLNTETKWLMQGFESLEKERRKSLCSCIDVSCTCILNTGCSLAFHILTTMQEKQKPTQRWSKAYKDLPTIQRLNRAGLFSLTKKFLGLEGLSWRWKGSNCLLSLMIQGSNQVAD